MDADRLGRRKFDSLDELDSEREFGDDDLLLLETGVRDLSITSLFVKISDSLTARLAKMLKYQ